VVFGVKWGQFQSALAENKLAVSNLDAMPNLDPQFREYLKARIYNNVREFYPSKPGYLLQKDWDRGPVRQDLLTGVAVAKDVMDPVWSWQAAIEARAQ